MKLTTGLLAHVHVWYTSYTEYEETIQVLVLHARVLRTHSVGCVTVSVLTIHVIARNSKVFTSQKATKAQCDHKHRSMSS